MQVSSLRYLLLYTSALVGSVALIENRNHVYDWMRNTYEQREEIVQIPNGIIYALNPIIEFHEDNFQCQQRLHRGESCAEPLSIDERLTSVIFDEMETYGSYNNGGPFMLSDFSIDKSQERN